LADSAEVADTKKYLAKIRQEAHFQNSRKNGFKQILERYDGVLGFSKATFYFKQRKVE
jgi:hypothetical protein